MCKNGFPLKEVLFSTFDIRKIPELIPNGAHAVRLPRTEQIIISLTFVFSINDTALFYFLFREIVIQVMLATVWHKKMNSNRISNVWIMENISFVWRKCENVNVIIPFDTLNLGNRYSLLTNANDRITKYSISFTQKAYVWCIADGKETMSCIQMNDARDVLCAVCIWN